jgi:hypothetical protein
VGSEEEFLEILFAALLIDRKMTMALNTKIAPMKMLLPPTGTVRVHDASRQNRRSPDPAA